MTRLLKTPETDPPFYPNPPMSYRPITDPQRPKHRHSRARSLRIGSDSISSPTIRNLSTLTEELTGTRPRTSNRISSRLSRHQSPPSKQSHQKRLPSSLVHRSLKHEAVNHREDCGNAKEGTNDIYGRPGCGHEGGWKRTLMDDAIT
jgi:hypothetical protein